LFVDVAKPFGDVKTVADFRERRSRDIEETKPVIAMFPRAAFDDVHGNRKRGAPRLRT